MPTRTVALKERIESGLPADIRPTGDRGISLDDVAAGRHTLEEFVAQLGNEDLEALTRGDRRMSERVVSR